MRRLISRWAMVALMLASTGLGAAAEAAGAKKEGDEPAAKENANRAANTVVLDENGVKNLRIETAEAEETDFEETVFRWGGSR